MSQNKVLQCAFVKYSDIRITDIVMYENRMFECIRFNYCLIDNLILLCMIIEHCVMLTDDSAVVDKMHIDVQFNTQKK